MKVKETAETVENKKSEVKIVSPAKSVELQKEGWLVTEIFYQDENGKQIPCDSKTPSSIKVHKLIKVD